MIYEDDKVVIETPSKAATKGHIIIKPKDDAKEIEKCTILPYLFQVGNTISTLLFEGFQMQGTNLILNENPLELHIIGRKENDGLDFQWKPAQMESGVLEEMTSAIAGKIVVGEDMGKSNPNTVDNAPPPETEKKENENETQETPENEGEDYRIRALRRIP